MLTAQDEQSSSICIAIKDSYGTVTFGDDGVGKIVGISNISIPPFLENVLLVDGLKANLISVRQLYNKDFDVTFKHNKCLIANNNSELVLEANRERNIYTIELNVSLIKILSVQVL